MSTSDNADSAAALTVLMSMISLDFSIGRSGYAANCISTLVFARAEVFFPMNNCFPESTILTVSNSEANSDNGKASMISRVSQM